MHVPNLVAREFMRLSVQMHVQVQGQVKMQVQEQGHVGSVVVMSIG